MLEPAFIKVGPNIQSFSVPTTNPLQELTRSPMSHYEDGRVTLTKFMAGAGGMRGISIGRSSH